MSLARLSNSSSKLNKGQPRHYTRSGFSRDGANTNKNNNFGKRNPHFLSKKSSSTARYNRRTVLANEEETSQVIFPEGLMSLRKDIDKLVAEQD